MKVREMVGRAALGAATALLAMLALAAMHVLPAMSMAISRADVAVLSAADAADGSTMTHAADHAGDTGGHAASMTPHGTTSTHEAGGVPADDHPASRHTLLHVCLAVLVAALAFVVARWLRPRSASIATPLAAVAQRLRLTLDVGPPNRVALCVVRC